jgi:hypothetical protein
MYLEQTVYNLPSDVFLVCGEQRALYKAVGTFCYVILGLQVFGCGAVSSALVLSSSKGNGFGYMRTLEFSSEAQVRAQSIIYELVGLAARRDNVVEFCAAGVGLAQVHKTEVGEWGVGFNELTIPELLLIIKAIRHLKLHAEAAG